MDKEQWIEIFTEINGRVPTEEEIQLDFRKEKLQNQKKQIILLNLHNLTLKRELMKIYLKELKMYKINKSSVMILFFVVHAEQRILLVMNDVCIVKKF